MEINDDGSIKGTTFTKKFNNVKRKWDTNPRDNETYKQYRTRINLLESEGFHLGDLGSFEWSLYCMGSGSYEGVDSNDKIYE